MDIAIIICADDDPGRSQAIVSQHLPKMRGWDIVEARRGGIHVFHNLTEPMVTHIPDRISRCDQVIEEQDEKISPLG